MHERATRLAWWWVGMGSMAAAGCAPHTHNQTTIVASLRPVDAARPMVVFSQVQGKACGRDAVLGAIRDMKRLSEVDGYLEVVVDETITGEQHCAQATAYPFRYGTSTSTPLVTPGPAETRDPVLIPGRPAAPVSSAVPASSGSSAASTVPAPFDCADACQRFAPLVETGTIKIALAKDRCEQRCKQPDLAFQKCIERAKESAAAKACSTP